MARLIVAAFLALGVWLLFGAPTFFTLRTMLLFLAPIISVVMMVWNENIFRFFSSDSYTYSLLGKTLSGFGFLLTLSSALWAYYVYFPLGELVHVKVPAFLWIGMLIGLFIPLCLPLATRRPTAPLPGKDVRRDYVDPS